MITNLDDLAVELGLIQDLQAEADRADAAYTQAIQDACQTGNWYMVPVAGHAAQQARAALTTGDQT